MYTKQYYANNKLTILVLKKAKATAEHIRMAYKQK